MNTKIFTSQALYEAAKVYVDWIPGDAYVAPHFTFVNDDDDALGEAYKLLSTGPNGKIEYINGYAKTVTPQGTHKYEDTVFCELDTDDQATDAKYLATLGITATINTAGEYQYTAVVRHQNAPIHEDETGKYYLANGTKVYLTEDDVTEILVGGEEVIDVNIIAVLTFHKSMEATSGYYLAADGTKYKATTDVWKDDNGLFCIPSDSDILYTYLKYVPYKEKIEHYYSYVGDNETTAILLPEEEANLETDEDGNVILFTTITHENALVESEELSDGTKQYFVKVNGNKVLVSEGDIKTTDNGIKVTKVSFEVWLTYHPEVNAVAAHYEDEAGYHYHIDRPDQPIVVKQITSDTEWKYILVSGSEYACMLDDLEVGSSED